MSYNFDLAEDLRRVRGGIDSPVWLLNNAHNHDLPDWDGWVKAARNDARVGREALARIEEQFRAVPA